jgi:hypothetical protein
VLVGANAVALLVTAPLGVSSPMILNRYLLVGLPFVIACAAAGLAEAWRVATAVRTALLRRAGRLAVLAAVSLLVLGGPLDDPRLLHSSFLTHDDFIDFYRPPPRMLSSELVPEFYRRLAVPPGDEAVIEAPSLPTWAWQTHLRIYQDVHRRRVFLAPLEPTFFRAELDFANYVEPEPEALAAAPARWLALHRKSDWELDRVDVNGVVSLPLEPGMRSFSQRSALELGGRLTGRWGPPDYVDDLLLVWDLERVRRDQAAVGRRRDSRLNTP